MMLWKSAALAVAIFLAASCGETPAPAHAPPPAASNGPALWRVADADTTIYLFGTVHVLPPELVWRTPAVDTALGQSKAVYFETDIEPDLNQMLTLIAQIGTYPPSQRLSDHLKPNDRTLLAAAAERLGLPMAQLDQARPWFAAITFSERIISNAGYDVSSGVERKLFPDARSAGKEIRKLETVEEQLRVFADLPEEVQIRFLMEGVRQMEAESKILAEMVNAWAMGDIAALDKVMIEDDLARSPEVYQALLVERNANWVGKLEELMKAETGTFFVAVGAAHLIGKDSVLAGLEPLGYKPERIH